MAVRKCGNVAGKLAVERVEDRLVLSAAFVTVTLTEGNTLSIQGDSLKNSNFSISEVVVKQGESSVHELQISGANGTKLRTFDEQLSVGKNNTILIPADDAVSTIDVELGSGSNNVSVKNLTTLMPDELSITSQETSGNNTISMSGLKAAAEQEPQIDVTLGSGSSSLTLSNSSLGFGGLNVRMNSAAHHNDQVKVTGSILGGAQVSTGDGNDHVVFSKGDSHEEINGGSILVVMGGGNDQFQINQVRFTNTGFSVDGGAGQDTASGTVVFPRGIPKSSASVTSAANHIHVAYAKGGGN